MSLSSLFQLVSRAGTTVSVTVASAGLVAIANAEDRPPIATPYGTVMSEYDTAHKTGWHNNRGGVVDLQAAADHIVAQQCMNGGWDWPHFDICDNTYNNLTGPIAGGLLMAYPGTQDPAHLASAVAGGNYDLLRVWPNSGTPRFSGMTAWFMNELTAATGDNTYANFAATEFFGRLDAGTYGDTGALMDTAAWIVWLQGFRAGTWINLLPWEFSTNIAAAMDLGTSGQVTQLINASLDGLNTLDNSDPGSVYRDTLGLAGGVRGLSFGNVTTFAPIISPLHPPINGIDNLTDLTNVLVSFQNTDGSWDWHSNLASPGESDKDTQTSAYAVLALIEAQNAGAGDYTAEIALGRQWLGSMQDIDGGFFSWPGGGYNTEVEAEATMALSSSSSLTLNTAMCESSGTLTVTIDMSDTAVDIVGGQFFLDFDTAALTFVSADPGVGTFTTEVFESIGAGTIDYAVGVPLGGPGTNTAETMATLTFTVNAENCTAVDSLVAFRSSVPPSRLTDDLGNPVVPALIDLNAVAFDETPPVVTTPSDITMNADAGVCDAVVTVPALVASDNCAIASIVNDYNFTADASDVYPQGTTTVTWTVTDTCGNATIVTQDVTINAMNTLDVTVELQATVAGGPFDRCITFELIPTGGGTPVVVSQTMSFNSGFATAAVDVPCGDYECIMARDSLHTLRKTDNDNFAIVGTNYFSDFTIAGDNDALIGGNLNDDDFIDILDFGIFVGQFGTAPGADTACGFVGPHADITGDNAVDSGDFTFIQINFLEFSEAPCTGAPLIDDGNNFAANGNTIRRDRPVVSVSVDDLIDMGMGDLVAADLNGDGMLDETDVAAFMGGMRPDHIADIDRSGTVDFFDLQTLMDHMGQQVEMPYDMNGDGVVNIEDLQFVIQRVGMTF